MGFGAAPGVGPTVGTDEIENEAVTKAKLKQDDSFNLTSTSGTVGGVNFFNLVDKTATETVSGAWNLSSASSTYYDVLASNLLDKSAGETVSGAYNFSDTNSSIGGVAGTNLVDKSASETITGAWNLGPFTSTGAYNLAGTSGSVGGVLNTNLVDKTASETVSGAYDFTDTSSTFGGVAGVNLLDKTAAETITAKWTLGTGGKINLTNALGTDQTVSGITTDDTVGESVVFGEVLYCASDGKYYRTDADTSSSMPAVAMAAESISANNSGELLHHGYARNDAWGWTPGGLLYASTTGGSMTQTASTVTGDQVQVVGYALTADIVMFNPSYVLVEAS